MSFSDPARGGGSGGGSRDTSGSGGGSTDTDTDDEPPDDIQRVNPGPVGGSDDDGSGGSVSDPVDNIQTTEPSDPSASEPTDGSPTDSGGTTEPPDNIQTTEPSDPTATEPTSGGSTGQGPSVDRDFGGPDDVERVDPGPAGGNTDLLVDAGETQPSGPTTNDAPARVNAGPAAPEGAEFLFNDDPASFIEQREQRQRAAERFDQQFGGVDIGPDDVELSIAQNGVRAELNQDTVEEIQSARVEGLRERAADQFGVEPEDIDVEETADGFTARVREGAEVEATGFDVVSLGDDFPGSADEAVAVGRDLASGEGAALIETDLPTNQREAQLAVRDTVQNTIDGTVEFTQESVDEAVRSTQQAVDDPVGTADDAVDSITESAGPAAGTAAAAGAVGVATPEPATTAAGGLLIAGAAGAAALSNRAEIDAPTKPEDEVSELSIGEETFSTELDVGSGDTEASEIDAPTEPEAGGEIDAPTGPGQQSGEVEAPGIESQSLVEPEQRREEDTETDDGTIIIGEEDIEDTGPLVEIPEEEQMEQIRDQLERQQDFVRDETEPGEFDDSDAFDFVDEGATGEEPVDEDVVTEPGVDTGTDTGTGTATGPGSGDDVFAPPAPPEDVTDQPTDTGTDVDAGVDNTQEVDVVSEPGQVVKPPAFDPAFPNPIAQQPAFEAATPSTGPPEETQPRRRPRDFEAGFDDDDEEERFGGVEADLSEETFEFDLPTPDFLGGDNG